MLLAPIQCGGKKNKVDCHHLMLPIKWSLPLSACILIIFEWNVFRYKYKHKHNTVYTQFTWFVVRHAACTYVAYAFDGILCGRAHVMHILYRKMANKLTFIQNEVNLKIKMLICHSRSIFSTTLRHIPLEMFFIRCQRKIEPMNDQLKSKWKFLLN